MADTNAEPVLYQKRIPIYPRSVKGRFRNLKYGIVALAYSVYFLLPWLRWERANAPDQAVLFDLPGRHFYLFGLVVQVQDLFWLAGLLVIAAMLLFFVTGVAGRVFCGYFCFQTLWTDVFMMIERLVQGDRPARLRLSKAPWGGEKLGKYAATYALWLGVAMLTGLTFTLYWADAPTLVAEMVRGEAPMPAYVTTLFLTATTFVMAGLAREQVCTYMCPYARFQSVMFDKDTLIVSYNEPRGEGSEGRHKLAKGYKTREERQAKGVGDCIECGYCVQVCPTGIDIRNGLQLQCISCALCVDACDTIMDNLGWPRGLVGYTSENALNDRKTRMVKPKTVGYVVVLLAAISLLGWSVINRETYSVSVAQVRQPLYVTLSDGTIQNSYEIKINNQLLEPMAVTIGIEGLPGAELDLGNLSTIKVASEQRLRILARVRLDSAAARGEQAFHFVIDPVSGPSDQTTRREALFYAP